MKVIIRKRSQGSPISSFESNDLFGVIEVAKGGVRVANQFFVYETHELGIFEEDGQVVQGLVIYVKADSDPKSDFFS